MPNGAARARGAGADEIGWRSCPGEPSSDRSGSSKASSSQRRTARATPPAAVAERFARGGARDEGGRASRRFWGVRPRCGVGDLGGSQQGDSPGPPDAAAMVSGVGRGDGGCGWLPVAGSSALVFWERCRPLTTGADSLQTFFCRSRSRLILQRGFREIASKARFSPHAFGAPLPVTHQEA